MGLQQGTGVARIYYWMKAAGAEFYGNEERTVSALGSPAAMQALEFIQVTALGVAGARSAGSAAGLTKEQSAIYEIGSWDLVNFLGLQSDGTPKLSFKWNVFPMPIGPSGERPPGHERRLCDQPADAAPR